MLTPFQPVDREAIWAALFAYLQAQFAGTFVTMGRHHIAPPQLLEAQQPACFLVGTKESRAPRPVVGAPVKITLQGWLLIYLTASPTGNIGAEAGLGETQLNQVFQAIDAAFAPDNPVSGRFTIGGLATHCWIEGDVDYDPGLYGPQCWAVVPIRILVP